MYDQQLKLHVQFSCCQHRYKWKGLWYTSTEQAVGGFPLGSGLVVEDRPSELSCSSAAINTDMNEC